jgi:hypothetical protein
MNVLIDANVVFDVHDFKLSHVPAVTPRDYLARFHPA